MNLIDAVIKQVGEPYKKEYDHGTYWMVDCLVTSYGKESQKTIIRDSKEKINKVSVGETIQI